MEDVEYFSNWTFKLSYSNHSRLALYDLFFNNKKKCF